MDSARGSSSPSWSCSFCGTQADHPAQLARGFGALICKDCVAFYYEAFQTEDGTSSRSPGDQLSVDEMLGKLPIFSSTASQATRLLREWVGVLREHRVPYAEIGKALGVSRQAAWERFSREH